MLKSDIPTTTLDKFKDIFGFLGNICTTKTFKNKPEKYYNMCCNKPKKSDLRSKRCDFLNKQRISADAMKSFYEKRLKLTKIKKNYNQTGDVSKYIQDMYKLYVSGIPLLLQVEFNTDLTDSTGGVNIDEEDALKLRQMQVFNGGTRRRSRSNSRKTKNNRRKWSAKYKKSINCRRPRGFSQKQYCKYGRKKNYLIKKIV